MNLPDSGAIIVVAVYTAFVALMASEFTKESTRRNHRCMTSNAHRCECGRMGCSVCKRWHNHPKRLTWTKN